MIETQRWWVIRTPFCIELFDFSKVIIIIIDSIVILNAKDRIVNLMIDGYKRRVINFDNPMFKLDVTIYSSCNTQCNVLVGGILKLKKVG